MSYINHINQSEKAETKDDVIDRMDDHIQEYIELIKDNIEYDHHMKYDQENDREIYDELFQVICDVVCVKRETVKIAGEDYPYALVQSQFLKLKGSHLEYVIFCMKKTTTKITNIKAYMITALYNAPATLDQIVLQDRKDKEIIGNERQCLKVSYECYQRLITGKQRCVFVRDDSYRETEVIEIYAADPSGYNTIDKGFGGRIEMNKKTRRLVKRLLIFIGLLLLGRLADYLPDVWWSLIIQIGVYSSAMLVGVKLLMDTNQSINDHCNHNDEK